MTRKISPYIARLNIVPLKSTTADTWIMQSLRCSANTQFCPHVQSDSQTAADFLNL